jgi:hypothetical protein
MRKEKKLKLNKKKSGHNFICKCNKSKRKKGSEDKLNRIFQIVLVLFLFRFFFILKLRK